VELPMLLGHLIVFVLSLPIMGSCGISRIPVLSKIDTYRIVHRVIVFVIVIALQTIWLYGNARAFPETGIKNY
jgi:hypothetical protein